MEEADLLKARLLAITNKRKIQEEITRQRFQVEGEKMKLKHLKSKGLRERWLMEGITAIPRQEQEAMKKQHQEDQRQSKQLEQNILRLAEEIENLENQEVQISADEQILLEKLKTTEDLIKAMKAGTDQDQVQFIYSKIPDLPKLYKPRNLQSTASPRTQTQEEEEPVKTALFAVEINVQKDRKTGESTVLSTVPVTVDEIGDRGVKVYEDGIKSVYAVRTDGGPTMPGDGVSDLTREEVEALLGQVEGKNESVSASPHAPVFSSSFRKGPSPEITRSEFGSVSPLARNQLNPSLQLQRRENHREAVFIGSELDNDPESSSADEETDIKFSLVRSLPAGAETEDPVTMIFLGYREVDHQEDDGEEEEEEASKVLSYDGAIRAELVVISDDDNSNEDDASEIPPPGNVSPGFSSSHGFIHRREMPYSSSNATRDVIAGDGSAPKNSLLVSGPATSTNHSAHTTYSVGQTGGVGSSADPPVSALKARMVKLGQRVMM